MGEAYLWPNGWTAKRESGETENGNLYESHWCLRDADGHLVDHDRYRFDLFDRHGLDHELGKDTPA